MKRFIRIVWFTVSLYVLTHIIAFAVLPVALVLVGFGYTASFLRLRRWFAVTVFRVVGQRPRVLDASVPTVGNDYVVVANYPSGYASFALMQIFPDASLVANEFLSRMPLLGAALRRSGTMFVSSRHPIRSLREIDRTLGSNRQGAVIIFPEGRRSSDGAIAGFKRGFVYILRRSGLGLLPVTLNGFYSFKPANRFWLDPDANLEVVVHEPIPASELWALTDKEIVATAERAVGEGYAP